MVKILSEAQQRTVHEKRKENDLYRHWLPILTKLHRECGEMDTPSLWLLAEQKIGQLKKSSYRETDIHIIYNELLDDCLTFTQNGKAKIERTPGQACQTAKTVMCVLLTMLLNAIKKDHEDEFFDNEPICMAILDILKEDRFFVGLMEFFLSRETGYDGKKVVITPHDPMLEDAEDEFVLKEKAIKQVLEQYNLTNKDACAVILSAHRKNWLLEKPTYKDACTKFGKKWSKDTYKYVNSWQDKLKQEDINLADDRLEEALQNLTLVAG